MTELELSLNQLADFTTATERGKVRIVKQQLNPDKFRIQWYQTPKAGIKKSIASQCNLTPIYEALRRLENKKPENDRQVNDKRISIEALKRFVNMKLPKVFKNNPYSIVKPKIKHTKVGNINIKVAPDVVVCFKVDGKNVLGAVKIHISKNNVFDYKQSVMISAILFKYLNDIKKKDEIVDPGLCFSLDVFGDRIVSAPINQDFIIAEVEKNCIEVQAILETL